MLKRHLSLRGLALAAALALCLPAFAEELGEMDLYDPSIHLDAVLEELPAEEPAAEEPVAEESAGALNVEAPVAEASGTLGLEGLALELEALGPDAPAEGEAGVAAPEAAEESATEIAAPEGEPDLRLGLGEQYALDGAALLQGVAAISYQSDHPEIASVDAATGVVTANGLGVARIAVAGEGATAACVVAVLNAPTALLLPGTALSLGKGEQRPLPVQLPEGCAAAGIRYASSKKSVVAVDAAGMLYGKKAGTAVITAAAYNGVQVSCKVRVVKAPSKVTLSAAKLVLSAGETRALKAKLPKNTASRIRWTSSNPAVVTVDESGNLRGVATGAATVTARTFNGKKASCKVAVLSGRAPTSLSLGGKTLSMGLKEKLKLQPVLGEGEEALFSYASSKKAVATVSAAGVVTAKKKGTAKIVVATHNGLKATITVKVVKAPSKVKLSATKLALSAGETARLTATLPAGTASAIAWESSAAAVASVEGGVVTALSPGTAKLRARTYNGKSATCTVTVAAASEPVTPVAPSVPASSAAQMAANLRASEALGGKRNAIASVVQTLVNAGFEPAFAAGVGGNVYSEGTYGMFESSKYITNYKKRPRYFCYLDGGEYYTRKDGEYVLTAVYLSQEEMAAYTGPAEARLRFDVENYYRDNYSGKYVQDIDLAALEAFMERLAAGNWEGKFGVGVVQWTGGRTRKLASFYRKHAGDSNRITAEQVMAAENEMIVYDLTGSYAGIYTSWKKANANPASAEAARSAGALLCLKYEIPVDKESKSVVRGNKAAEIYRIMMGE